jgi:hypothetical protein
MCFRLWRLLNSSKYSLILDFPIPKNADEVKRFVAFCNYYRKFIKNFAEITRPLNVLTRKNTKFIWSSECQQVFENLQYPNFNKPFILTCDASKYSSTRGATRNIFLSIFVMSGLIGLGALVYMEDNCNGV